MLVTIAKAQQLAQRIDFAVRIMPGKAIEIIQKELGKHLDCNKNYQHFKKNKYLP